MPKAARCSMASNGNPQPATHKRSFSCAPPHGTTVERACRQAARAGFSKPSLPSQHAPDNMKQLPLVVGFHAGVEFKLKGKLTVPLISCPCWSRVRSSYLSGRHTHRYACMRLCSLDPPC